MAFKVADYGNGALGDVTSVTETINSYARVTAVSGKVVTIKSDTVVEGTATFAVGAKVLLHVSSTTSSSYKTYLGKYLLANVTEFDSENGKITLDADVTTKLIPSANLAQYYVQIIAVAQYKNLTLNTGTAITPPVYSASSYHGGIVALMCSEKLTFNGGNIALADRGIPTANSGLRPWLNQESTGRDDINNYAGWENDCSRFFPLNCGDGAAFIVAKEMGFHSNSRIGNVVTYGVQFYRGSSTSVTYNENAPSNATNVGGSSIFIAAETITNFTPRMIAKYRTSTAASGSGLCRCYIASETKLRNDEGLYAYDCISKPGRVREMNIKNFGDGSFGDLNNVTGQMNNYATVTAINGNKVSYKGQTTAGLAQIAAGALVMVHWSHKNSTTVADSGRFYLAKVLSDNGSVLTLDTTLPEISVTNYACQVVSIPQCNNFTLSGTNAATIAFNGTQGGIFAIAVKNSCNLNNGIIDVRAKGGGSAYGRNGLAVIGNAQNSNKLPIGQGHGSVFILAQNLTMNTSTRIGSIYSGQPVHAYKSNCGGTQSGSGANGGTYSGGRPGGYGGNGVMIGNYPVANQWYVHCQGAHVMIVADKITGFNQYAISTGGGGYSNSSTQSNNYVAGSGYSCGNPNYPGIMYNAYNGGTASVNTTVSSSGSAGWCFVYCNTAVSQNTNGTIYDG